MAQPRRSDDAAFAACIITLLLLGNTPQSTAALGPAASGDWSTQPGAAGSMSPDVGNTGIVCLHATVIPKTTQILCMERVEQSNFVTPNHINPNPGMVMSRFHPSGEIVTVYDWKADRYEPIFIKDNVFCAGQGVMSDGRPLIIGGHISAFFEDGRRLMRTFDPDTKSFTDIGRLNVNRWYPTVTQLADGVRFMIMGGSSTTYNYKNVQQSFEVLNPFTGSKQFYDDQDQFSFLKGMGQRNIYAFVSLLPNHSLFIFACNYGQLFDWDNRQTLAVLPPLPVPNTCLTPQSTGSYARLMVDAPYTDAELVLVGGQIVYNNRRFGVNVNQVAKNTIFRIRIGTDAPASSLQWAVEYLPEPRVMADCVLLPNGLLLIVNGAQRGPAGGAAGENRARNPNTRMLLYDPKKPAGQRIVKGPASDIIRMYHSVAVLLVDGTVMIAGTDQARCTGPGATASCPFEYRSERYLPYYIGSPSRPSIVACPQQIHYNVPFVVRVTGQATGASIISTPAVTHGLQMNQNGAFLTMHGAKGNQITLEAPFDGYVCPPGYYMLYVLNDDVPSEGCWVQLLN